MNTPLLYVAARPGTRFVPRSGTRLMLGARLRHVGALSESRPNDRRHCRMFSQSPNTALQLTTADTARWGQQQKLHSARAESTTALCAAADAPHVSEPSIFVSSSELCTKLHVALLASTQLLLSFWCKILSGFHERAVRQEQAQSNSMRC